MLATITQTPQGEGFQFGRLFVRIVRGFITEAGTTEDIGFAASDLAKALEHTNSRTMVSALDPDQKGVSQVYTLGGTQSLTVISESGFYDVVVRSDKPAAKPLRNLVTRQILPALRKTGTYSVAQAAPPAPVIPSQAEGVVGAYMRIAAALTGIGVHEGIAYASALASIEQVTGLPVESMRRALPAAEKEVPTLNATGIGKQLGISAKAVNKRLIEAGLQFRTSSGHLQLTKRGMEFGEAIPYSRNGHAGYQLLWRPAVLSQLKPSNSRQGEKQ